MQQELGAPIATHVQGKQLKANDSFCHDETEFPSLRVRIAATW